MHLACLAVLLVLHCLPVEAETSTIPNPVVLKDKQPVRDLGGYVAYLLDSTQSLGIEDILRPETMARFRVSPDSEPSFGYRSDHIWLWIRLSNRSTLTEEWKLHLHNNFLHVIDVFVVHEDGRIVQPLSQRHDSPFDTRQLAYHQLVADLRIRGGSDADIYLRYRSGGHTGLRPTIESNSSFEMLATDKAAKAFLFQGILLLLNEALHLAEEPVFFGRKLGISVLHLHFQQLEMVPSPVAFQIRITLCTLSVLDIGKNRRAVEFAGHFDGPIQNRVL